MSWIQITLVIRILSIYQANLRAIKTYIVTRRQTDRQMTISTRLQMLINNTYIYLLYMLFIFLHEISIGTKL